MRVAAATQSETPLRRATPVARRDGSITPTRRSQMERSRMWERTSNGGSSAQRSMPSLDFKRKNRRDLWPVRSSLIFDDRSVTTLTHTSSVYSPPPFHPKEAAEFWSRMKEDNDRLTEMHQKICESKGILLQPKKRSGSSASHGAADMRSGSVKSHSANPRSAADASSPASHRRGASGERQQRPCSTPLAPKVKIQSRSLLNDADAAACSERASDVSRLTSRHAAYSPAEKNNTPAGIPAGQLATKQRPTISADADKGGFANGTYTSVDRRAARDANQRKKQRSADRGNALKLKINDNVETTSSSESPVSGQMNGRRETAPYVDELTGAR